MGKQQRLGRHVTIGGATYGPTDEVPADVAKQIRNPKAWVPADETQPEEDPDHEPGTSSGARLATTVTVGGVSYGPKDFVPDDVAAQIRNPKAWADGKAPTADAKKAAAPKGDGEDEEPAGPAPSTEDEDTTDDAPPAEGDAEPAKNRTRRAR